jgi:uncharacterized protein (DUF934 family)
MQEVNSDGSLAPVVQLAAGKELEQILAALEKDDVVAVNVGPVKDGRFEAKAHVTRGPAKVKSRRWRRVRRKRRKEARKSRKRNR